MTHVVVITGLSGSGKTLALRCLEDMGHFAVDNLPVPLTESFIDLLARGEGSEPSGAMVVDVREGRHLEPFPELLARLRERTDVQLTVIFLRRARTRWSAASRRAAARTRWRRSGASRWPRRSPRSGSCSRRCARWPTASSPRTT